VSKHDVIGRIQRAMSCSKGTMLVNENFDEPAAGQEFS